ncbi:NuoI/complex I 23 kDa subunit family protein [Rubricoccus marinus]|uniref:NuoI/complex I 23 kDa subunit family protein n=1 Tax=Rubricoccus marinus TaxID=716817 RepID=UPI000B987CD7|nr:NADH-quinone oxidoreductase subunit I [Rubricoccus marinus]
MPGQFVDKSTPDERKLNFWERLYLPEIFKGLGYSASKMKLESYSFQYPEEQWYPPDSYRGRPVLVEEQGRPRCVACGLCARSCPPLAISMQAHEVTDDIKEREPEWFEINMLRCIYCGFCEEVCPEEAIVMSKEYDLTFQDREEAHFGIDKLLVPKERLTDRLNFLQLRRNGAPSGDWKHRQDNNVHTLRNRLDYMAGLEESLARADEHEPPNTEVIADA